MQQASAPLHFETILVKAHPFMPADGALAACGLTDRVTVTDNPLIQLWDRVTVVFASNSTTSAVEAALYGLPVIIHVDEDGLNLSPIWHQEGIAFADTPESLEAALRTPPDAHGVMEDFFYLDKELPGWRAVLEGRSHPLSE